MERDKMQELVLSSLKRLYTEDQALLELTAHEETFNGRLACYLREVFETGKIKVDTEYHRHGAGQKHYGLKRKKARVDIVVHERGTDENNLIALECKMDQMSETDIEKIEALIGPEYQYRIGVTVQYGHKLVTIYELIDEKIRIEKIKI